MFLVTRGGQEVLQQAFGDLFENTSIFMCLSLGTGELSGGADCLSLCLLILSTTLLPFTGR